MLFKLRLHPHMPLSVVHFWYGASSFPYIRKVCGDQNKNCPAQRGRVDHFVIESNGRQQPQPHIRTQWTRTQWWTITTATGKKQVHQIEETQSNVACNELNSAHSFKRLRDFCYFHRSLFLLFLIICLLCAHVYCINDCAEHVGSTDGWMDETKMTIPDDIEKYKNKSKYKNEKKKRSCSINFSFIWFVRFHRRFCRKRKQEKKCCVIVVLHGMSWLSLKSFLCCCCLPFRPMVQCRCQATVTSFVLLTIHSSVLHSHWTFGHFVFAITANKYMVRRCQMPNLLIMLEQMAKRSKRQKKHTHKHTHVIAKKKRARWTQN